MTTPRAFRFFTRGWHSFFLWDGAELHECGPIPEFAGANGITVDSERDLVATVDQAGVVQCVRGLFSRRPQQRSPLPLPISPLGEPQSCVSLALVGDTLFAGSDDCAAIFAVNVDAEAPRFYEVAPSLERYRWDCWYTRLLVLDQQLLQLCSNGQDVEWRVFALPNTAQQPLSIRRTVTLQRSFDVGECWDIAMSTNTLMLFTTTELPSHHPLIVFFDRYSLQVLFTVALPSHWVDDAPSRTSSCIVHFDGWGPFLALCDQQWGIGLYSDGAIRALAGHATNGCVTLEQLLTAGRWISEGSSVVEQMFICDEGAAAVLTVPRDGADSLGEPQVRMIELG